MSLGIRIGSTVASRARDLMRAIQFSHPPNCPCHSSLGHHHQTPSLLNQVKRSLATPADLSRQKEYAFEMSASSIRFGPGCTKEVGMDLINMGTKKVCVVTDGNVSKLDAMAQVTESLTREGIEFVVFDQTRVEPKDSS